MEPRIEQIVGHFGDKEVDAIVTLTPENRRYVTGFTGSFGCVLLGRDETVLITDSRYMEQAKLQSPGVTLVLKAPELMDTLAEQVQRLRIKRLGFEPDAVTYKWYQSLQQGLPGVELVAIPSWMEDARMVKSTAELSAIREAARIADAAFAHVLEKIRPGVTEQDVALELEVYMRKQGASDVSFQTIVASGERSAMPHGVASDRVILAGEFVTMDFGAFYHGYASDITRTVVVGPVTDRHRAIYNVVLRAQLAGIAGIHAGVTGHVVDQLGRDIISAAGFGDQFGHSFGHGLGLAVHEWPRLAQKSPDVLQEGMVVTAEPGVYLPGYGGVRIEDDVLVTHDGCEVLTHATKELLVL